jgi:immunity protein 52 of polymorphic toxin system
MSKDEFRIGGNWSWRQETASELGERFLHTLDRLTTISSHFSSWQLADLDFDIDELRHSDDPKLNMFRLEDVRNRFTAIVERGVATSDDGEAEPVYGYSIMAYNYDHVPNPFSVGLSARGGGEPSAGSYVSFSTDSDGIPDPSIVSYPVFKSALLALVSIWELASARAAGGDLSEHREYPPLRYDLNWMTYLSAPLAAQITPPPGVICEQIKGGGLLLIATEESFDASNPSHLGAARKIRDALAPLNYLEEHERWKQEILESERQLQATGFPGHSIAAKEIRRRQNSQS